MSHKARMVPTRGGYIPGPLDRTVLNDRNRPDFDDYDQPRAERRDDTERTER